MLNNLVARGKVLFASLVLLAAITLIPAVGHAQSVASSIQGATHQQIALVSPLRHGGDDGGHGGHDGDGDHGGGHDR